MRTIVLERGKGVVVASLLSSLVAAAGNLIFVGDSTLAPRKPEQRIGSWGDSMADKLKKDWKIVNFATGGATVKSIQNGEPSRWKRALNAAEKGDFVLVQFGINDANKVKDIEKFKKDLTSIVGMVRKAKAIPVLQVPMLTTDGQANRPAYAEAVRAVADKEKCLLVDHAAHWKEASGSDTAKAEWMNNAIHPNALGHRIMVYTIAKELGIQPKNSPTLKLPEK